MKQLFVSLLLLSLVLVASNMLNALSTAHPALIEEIAQVETTPDESDLVQADFLEDLHAFVALPFCMVDGQDCHAFDHFTYITRIRNLPIKPPDFPLA